MTDFQARKGKKVAEAAKSDRKRGRRRALTAFSGPFEALGVRLLLQLRDDDVGFATRVRRTRVHDLAGHERRCRPGSLVGRSGTRRNGGAAVVRRERRADWRPFLSRPNNRRRQCSPCARCKVRSTCFVCSAAVACNGSRVPALHCDLNRLLDRHREMFMQERDSLDGALHSGPLNR